MLKRQEKAPIPGPLRVDPISRSSTAESRRHEQEADRAAAQIARSENWPQSAGATGTRRPLDSGTRHFFERHFGHNFADVRVHVDSRANEIAHSLTAEAVTIGADIFFRSGNYRTSTDEGRYLLAHELAHVVQQSAAPSLGPSLSRYIGLSKARSYTAQCKLVATGQSKDFAALMNSILAVQDEVRVADDGEVSIHATNTQGPPTRDASELLSTLRTIINDKKTTIIEFIRGAKSTRPQDVNVIVGNYQLSAIDLDDVEKFGLTSSHSREGDNAAVQLIHELTEQYQKQVYGEGYTEAHKAGYAAQERLLDAKLVSESPMTPVEGDLGEVTTTYEYSDGRMVDVITRMNFKTGQIVKVERKIRKKVKKVK